MKASSFDAYLERMLQAPRPGSEHVLAFYEHRVGAIGTDARLLLAPLDDHLCHRGDGVFETITARQGRLFQLDAHLERMRNSAAGLTLTPPCSWDEIRERIIDVARAAARPELGIRVLIGRGPGGFGIAPSECPQASLYIIAMHSAPPSREKYERGLTAFRSAIPAKQEYLARIKNTNYLPNVMMAEEAQQRGMDVAVSFDTNDCIAEAAIANVCIVASDGTLVCPEFRHSLPGTTVLRAMEVAAQRMPTAFRAIPAAEIATAREMLLFSSTPLCMGITHFDGNPIGNGKTGETAHWLAERLLECMLAEGTPF